MKLTIVVPTYNRAAYLKRAVESVLDQLPSAPADVSLVLRIYDNASTDRTPEVCADLVAREPRMQVFRNNANIGGDANILRGLSEADSDYVWVIGDDDYLRAGTLGALCRLLATRQFDLLKMGSVEERDVRSSGTAVMGAPKAALESKLTVERFASASDVLDRFGMGLGNFSSIIFSCDFFRSFHRPASTELFQSGYSQLEWIYRGLYARPMAFGHVVDPVLVLRIEISPRDVTADKVNLGLDLLRGHLLEIGYPDHAAATFHTRQHDAILLGQVKTRKIFGVPMWRELATALRGLSNGRQRMKLLLIAVLPSRLYRELWVRL